MKGYNRPCILKSETETETASVFSNRDCDGESVFIGDLEDPGEILVRLYNCLRADTIFGAYTLASVTDSLPQSTMGIIFDFLNHIRQNGEVTPVWQNAIAINDERARREIKLLNHLTLANTATTNRPTLGGILSLMRAGPKLPPLIEASEACNHLRKHLRVRGTVTQIEANRRGDLILLFESSQEVFRVVIPVSCDLSKEQEWINSLKNRKLTVTGRISFYALKPAIRILEKDQIADRSQSVDQNGTVANQD
jgi:hypothetical protein